MSEKKIQSNKNSKRAVGKMVRREYYEYSGPMPHPELLNQYDVKTRKEIVSLAVGQSKHRQFIEKKVVNSNVFNEKTGMILSFLLTAIMMIMGGFLVNNDKSVIGLLTIFTPAIFQAKNFYDQKAKEKKVSKKH